MNILKYLGYAAFFLFSLVVSLYLSFPWDAAKDRALALLAERAKLDMKVATLKPSWVTGFVAETVELTLEPGKEPIALERLEARLHLLPLLSGGVGVTIFAPIAQGELSGDVVIGDEGYDIDATATGIELALVPGLADMTGLPLGGKVDITADIFYGLKDPTKTEGTITLKAAGLELLKGGKISGFEVPGLEIGSLDWKIPVEKGKAKLDQLQLQGDNLNAKLDGEIVILNPPSRSNLSFVASFKPSEAFMAKEPAVKGALSFIQNAKGPDGFFAYSISGSFAHPRPPRPYQARPGRP